MRLTMMVLLMLALAGCASGNGGTKKLSVEPQIGSENPYATSYVSREAPTVALQPDPDGPKVYRGNVKEDDYQKMLENGFDLLGYSSFDAGDVPPQLLTEQAKKVKADVVLVYTKLTGAMPSSIKIQQMREQAKQAESTPVESNPGLDKMGKLLPAVTASYSYFAAYWVKLAPPIIGVHVKAPAKDENATGLIVQAVIKQSPAEKAGLQASDIIVSIGDVTLDKPVALTQAAQRYAGQTVELAYERNGMLNKTPMTLNNK
jgi:hypothetical protein